VSEIDAVCSTRPFVQQAPTASEATDVLTAFLAPCRVQCRRTRLWRFTAPWGIELAGAGPGFLAVLDGAGLLRRGGATGDLVLRQNDLVVLTREESVVLRDQPGSRIVANDDSPTSSSLATCDTRHLGGGGPATSVLWGALTSDDDYTRQALHLLPPLLLAPGEGRAAARLKPLLSLLLAELEERRPGGALFVDKMVHGLLVVALRETPPNLPDSVGLVKALSVPGLGVALAAMHTRPAREWSVSELAGLAGLSRSKFSLRFVEMLGCPPFDYLRDVRMRLACQLLQDTDHGIKEVSARVGYGTEASFSRAFSNWCGTAPGTYRRQKRSAPAEGADTGRSG
jgi:AraC-like DNA-binding protein